MRAVRNPSREVILLLINTSEEYAAKWIKDAVTGDLYFWRAEKFLHEDVAKALRCRDYTQGIMTSAMMNASRDFCEPDA